MGEWLNGCEICNIGLVAEMKEIIETGVSERKAADMLAKMAAQKIGDELYTAAAIRARYQLHTGKRDPNKQVVHNEPLEPYKQPGRVVHREPQESRKTGLRNRPQLEELGANYIVERIKAVANAQRPKPSELEIAEKSVIATARYLDRIVSGHIRDNGTDTDQLTAASIVRHGPGIIFSFIKLGIDVFKVHEFYTGKSAELPEISGEGNNPCPKPGCTKGVGVQSIT